MTGYLIPCPMCVGRNVADYCQTCQEGGRELARWADGERAKSADMVGPREACRTMAEAGRRYRTSLAAATWQARPHYSADDRTRVAWLPHLASFETNGTRGWARLAAVHEFYGLAELGNPYAAGLVDVPEAMGYTPFAVTDDGDTLCHRCIVDPANPVHPYVPGRSADGRGVAAWSHDGAEDGPVTCGHCSAVIIDDPDGEEVGR